MDLLGDPAAQGAEEQPERCLDADFLGAGLEPRVEAPAGGVKGVAFPPGLKPEAVLVAEILYYLLGDAAGAVGAERMEAGDVDVGHGKRTGGGSRAAGPR